MAYGTATPTTSIGLRFLRERRTWSTSPTAVAWLLATPLVLQLLATAVATRDPAAFMALTEEDGVIEWFQILALVGAAVTFVAVAVTARRAGQRSVVALAVLAAIALMFVAGEEISWGQRLLGWTTPEALGSMNVQGETNLHNLGMAEAVLRGGQVAVATLAGIVPLIVLLTVADLGRVARFLVAPVAVAFWFLPLLVYWLLRWPVDPTEIQYRYSEIVELTAFIGIALVAALNVRRLSAVASSVRPARG